MSRGRYIALEGVDNVGKTSQIGLLMDALEESGIHTMKIVEPDDKVLEGKPRQLLKKASERLSPMAEAFGHSWLRVMQLERAVAPALNLGAWVVSDRCFVSTIVYQGHVQGEDLGEMRQLAEFATRAARPDLYILLDGDPEVLESRAQLSKQDRHEAKGLRFQHQLREAYRQEFDILAAGGNAVAVVDAQSEPKDVFADIWVAVEKLIKEE